MREGKDVYVDRLWIGSVTSHYVKGARTRKGMVTDRVWGIQDQDGYPFQSMTDAIEYLLKKHEDDSQQIGYNNKMG